MTQETECESLTPEEALQKILDALDVRDLNLNSRGLFEGYIRRARLGKGEAKPVEVGELRARVLVWSDCYNKNDPVSHSERAPIEVIRHSTGDNKADYRLRHDHWGKGWEGTFWCGNQCTWHSTYTPTKEEAKLACQKHYDLIVSENSAISAKPVEVGELAAVISDAVHDKPFAILSEKSPLTAEQERKRASAIISRYNVTKREEV